MTTKLTVVEANPADIALRQRLLEIIRALEVFERETDINRPWGGHAPLHVLTDAELRELSTSLWVLAHDVDLERERRAKLDREGAQK
jgi:hypothetical protein